MLVLSSKVLLTNKRPEDGYREENNEFSPHTENERDKKYVRQMKE